MVYSNQQAYYDAIAASTAAGESTPFIAFMLGEILKTLKEHQGEEKSGLQDKLHDKLHDKFPEVSEAAWKILDAIIENPHLKALELTERTQLKERMVRNHLATLKNLGLIERQGSNKTGYWKVNMEGEV